MGRMNSDDRERYIPSVLRATRKVKIVLRSVIVQSGNDENALYSGRDCKLLGQLELNNDESEEW